MAAKSRKGAENKERGSPGFKGRATAADLGLQLSPHDLRRTCAKLCRLSGGALEQIQFLLGHASVQTTERYLGGKQEITVAVNDHLPLGGE